MTGDFTCVPMRSDAAQRCGQILKEFEGSGLPFHTSHIPKAEKCDRKPEAHAGGGWHEIARHGVP